MELGGFDKTKLLAPGESETLTIQVAREDMAAYDSKNAKTYILDAGDYYITAASNSHKAINNILAAKGYEVDGNPAFTHLHNEAALDTETYSVSSSTGYEITNQFDNADLNNYGVELTYLSRSDWQGTWPEAITLEATEQMFDDGLYMYQTYKGIEGSTTEMPVMGAKNGLNLAMFIGVDYNDVA